MLKLRHFDADKKVSTYISKPVWSGGKTRRVVNIDCTTFILNTFCNILIYNSTSQFSHMA